MSPVWCPPAASHRVNPRGAHLRVEDGHTRAEGVAAGGGQVCPQRRQRDPRLDRGVPSAPQRAQQLTAQRGVASPDAGRVQQLQLPVGGVGLAQRRFGDSPLGGGANDGERAVGPEPDSGHVGADAFPHSSRARNAAGSSLADRPETQTSPKLRTVAPRACRSRSRWWTS